MKHYIFMAYQAPIEGGFTQGYAFLEFNSLSITDLKNTAKRNLENGGAKIEGFPAITCLSELSEDLYRSLTAGEKKEDIKTED